MAPRKRKFLGKRNNLKIKSKINPKKREGKIMKKSKAGEKPLENLKWLRPISDTSVVNRNKTNQSWFDDGVCKHRRSSCKSVSRSPDDTGSVPEDTEIKSTSTDCSEVSENSDECHCLYPKYAGTTKAGILKRNISSTDNVVAKYIKSGMDHVASFIVESAIRFGEQHGVVVADKNVPNVYEIVTPDKRYDEKSKKIRFKLNKKEKRNQNHKWRTQVSKSRVAIRSQEDENSATDEEDSRPSETCYSKSSSWSSKTDSLEDILPLLEKLKNDNEIVTSELDLEMLQTRSDEERPVPRDRCMVVKDRLRDRHSIFDKRYKSLGATSKPSVEEDYTKSKYPWKKRLRRESLDVRRSRPRGSTCPRKDESFTPISF